MPLLAHHMINVPAIIFTQLTASYIAGARVPLGAPVRVVARSASAVRKTDDVYRIKNPNCVCVLCCSLSPATVFVFYGAALAAIKSVPCEPCVPCEQCVPLVP